MKWKQGQSGNPKGKPKGIKNKSSKAKKIVKDAMRECLTEEAMAEVWDAMIRKAKRGNTEAAKLLVAYKYGKPSQTHNIESELPLKSINFIIK